MSSRQLARDIAKLQFVNFVSDYAMLMLELDLFLTVQQQAIVVRVMVTGSPKKGLNLQD
jgi:hypothetical protein